MRAGIKRTGCILLVLMMIFGVASCGDYGSEDSGMEDESTYIFSMGTVFEIRVIGEDAGSVISEISQALYDADRQISWREEGSAAYIFNTCREADFSETEDLIGKCLKVCELSGGALDITVLPLTQLWGFDTVGDEEYDPSLMSVPDPEEIATCIENVDYTQLIYDPSSGILSSDNENIRIELGAAGKGYAIDRARYILENSEACGGMVSAGSSIYVFGTKADGSGFRVGLRDPRGEEDDLIGVLTLTDTSVSTSGDYERYFEDGGVRYHHILDPGTGYPADSGLMQVSIICDDGVTGDALSTACFVLGLEDGMALAESFNVSAIFVDTDRNVWYNDSSVLDVMEFSGADSGYVLKEYH